MGAEIRSKDEILRRIRAANGGPSNEEAARSRWEAIPRRYKRLGTQPLHGVLELLEDRLRDYDATVFHCERQHLATCVARRLAERSKRRIVVPIGVPVKWLPEGFEFVVDEKLAATDLDAVDGVLTGASIAIAETGTVVLQNVPEQGRRAISLVPDYHLCLVCVDDVVETVPEALRCLQDTAGLATTFISGPSATADIEMTRIKGVHGPRVLDVILFG
jgi:L-lactate dehydrogenase complex protein LldG